MHISLQKLHFAVHDTFCNHDHDHPGPNSPLFDCPCIALNASPHGGMMRQVRSPDYLRMRLNLGHIGWRANGYRGGDVTILLWLLADFAAVSR